MNFRSTPIILFFYSYPSHCLDLRVAKELVATYPSLNALDAEGKLITECGHVCNH